MSEALAALHFIRPAWLLAVIPALLVARWWARRRAAGSHWESAVAPELLAVLLEGGVRRRSRHLPWLAGLALCAAAIGLAGPTWERLPQPVERKTDALVVVFDLSLSMFAEDVSPSRLVRARQKIADILRRRDEGYTALVAYAGDAHAVVPLTDDTRTIENLLPALAPDMMPVLGSDLGQALDAAIGLFENAGIGQGRILVVTDGVDEMSDATERRDPRFPISFLGVGTAAGANIPLDFVNQPGQVLRRDGGEAVVVTLDEDRLSKIADLTYGRYRTLTLADGDIEHLLRTPLPGDDDTDRVERQFDTWADKGFWVAVLLIPLLLAGFRRGAIALVPLLLLPPPANAGLWDDLWARRDQQAYQALIEGEPETAATLFQDERWRAAALYRSREFEGAARAYRNQPTTDALYNLGNALAHQEQFDAAIEAYDAVLARDPDHEDARHNKDVLERLEQDRRSDDDDQGRQQSGGRNPQQSTSPQDRGEDQGDDQPDSQDGQSQQSQPRESEAEQTQPSDEGDDQRLAATRDERRDALEQWLRRVPDDPGGLLRRKFQYETNQRLRRGDYRSQETEKIW